MHTRPHVLVLGAGIIGLTTARTLQDEGYDVEIWASDTLKNTCSSVAAAFWYPYVIQPEEAVLDWGISTLEKFKSMEQDTDSGICKRQINALFTEATPDPVWATEIPSFARLSKDQLPDSHCDGFCFESVSIEMPTFLPYITRQFRENGGTLTERTLEDLAEALDAADIVINCTGLGAKQLCNDEDLTPVRGQVVVTKKGDLDCMYSDCKNMVYMVPFEGNCVLGGTAQMGDDDMEPREEDKADILAKCSATLPEVADWEVIEQRVGLRPARSSVRLEQEETSSGKLLIHNYGHGGAGVTLSYGCAASVAKMVEEFCRESCVA